jgi:putative intracellular protease/amidase
MTTKGKVLVLVSSGHGLPLKDGKVYAGAGYYLNELTVPVRALMKEGYEITFANPKGNTPPDWAQKSNSHLGCHRIGPGSI